MAGGGAPDPGIIIELFLSKLPVARSPNVSFFFVDALARLIDEEPLALLIFFALLSVAIIKFENLNQQI